MEKTSSMITDKALAKIKSAIIKHNQLRKLTYGMEGNAEKFEYEFCLYQNENYQNKYFVISKENVYENESLKNILLNSYVFDGNGNDIDFDTTEIDLNGIIENSDKICNIL